MTMTTHTTTHMTTHRHRRQRRDVRRTLGGQGAHALPRLAQAGPPTQEIRSGDSAQIDAWVTRRMAAHRTPGAAVAVVRGGAVVHLAGYGTDGLGRAATPVTPFLVGSVSKPFTAAVVSQLVAEGVLAWDEPVWPHLSAITDGHPDGFEHVTIEQLLTHTAGLGMTHGTAGTVQIHGGHDALELRVADLLSRPLTRPPGEAFTYSNAGPVLLAAVVEHVTGRSFAEELRQRVLEPLGMQDTFATAAEALAAPLATGHQRWFGRWRPADLPYDEAGVAMGYIGSTARDLAVFAQAHLDGHAAVGTAAADIAGGPVAATAWSTPLDAGYGQGWFVDDLDGTPVVSHPGSLGHFTAHVLLAPEVDLGVVVLTNASAIVAAGHEAQYDLGLGLTHLLLGEEPQPTDPSVWTSVVAPAVAWAMVVALAAMGSRDLARRYRDARPAARRGRWRSTLPAVALLVGGGMLAAPLGLLRHFYPDVGWAVTAVAVLAVTWGTARLALVGVTMWRGRSGVAPTDLDPWERRRDDRTDVARQAATGAHDARHAPHRA